MSYMIEAAARRKQCCMDRYRNCDASDCMGWRWAYREEPMFWERENSPTQTVQVFLKNGEVEEWVCPVCEGTGKEKGEDGQEIECRECEGKGKGTTKLASPAGFCGLAGVPHVG